MSYQRNSSIEWYNVTNCATCREKLRRVHRTLTERLLYVAVYECRQCKTRRPEPRWYALYLGDYPRCPRCGTYRLTRLATRDRIDPMYKSIFSFAQRVFGASLYHCRYCRVQFYDMRGPLSPEAKERVATGVASGGTAKPA